MGPDGGRGGGSVICLGSPEEVAKHAKSYTAAFLRDELLDH
jgi:excinuclease ABC subunit A